MSIKQSVSRFVNVAAWALALFQVDGYIRGADTLDPALQAKIDAHVKQIQSWASEAVIVNAVKQHNAQVPPEYTAMTQQKWESLAITDPFVRSFDKNPVGQFLKSKKSEVLVEMFVSDAAGLKVGFMNKTSNWCHKGKPKHDLPMAGKTWQGPSELDASSGMTTIQVAVPILEGAKPIGSLVVGLSATKLGKD